MAFSSCAVRGSALLDGRGLEGSGTTLDRGEGTESFAKDI
jgi:hypothetical protein